MEFHQLRYFVAAAEEMSMSRAAGRVHVSQPALSRQIALLEEEIGVLLFDRIRKRIHLTEAGRFFLVKAKQLLCDAELVLPKEVPTPELAGLIALITERAAELGDA